MGAFIPYHIPLNFFYFFLEEIMTYQTFSDRKILRLTSFDEIKREKDHLSLMPEDFLRINI